MEENKGFTVYQNYWKAIEFLPEDIQKEVCLALVKYGITQEMPDPVESPIAFSLIQSWKISLDNSIERMNKAEINGSKGGRPSNIDSEKLKELIAAGKKANEIAKELGVSPETIYKRKEWKERVK